MRLSPLVALGSSLGVLAMPAQSPVPAGRACHSATADHVGTWNETRYAIETAIQMGQVSYEAQWRGKLTSFGGNTLTFAKPFHGCDNESLTFFEAAFKGVEEKDTRMRIVCP